MINALTNNVWMSSATVNCFSMRIIWFELYDDLIFFILLSLWGIYRQMYTNAPKTNPSFWNESPKKQNLPGVASSRLQHCTAGEGK